MPPREKPVASLAEQPDAPRVVVVGASPVIDALPVGRVVYDDGRAYRITEKVPTAILSENAIVHAVELHLEPVESALAALREDERDGADER